MNKWNNADIVYFTFENLVHLVHTLYFNCSLWVILVHFSVLVQPKINIKIAQNFFLKIRFHLVHTLFRGDLRFYRIPQFSSWNQSHTGAIIWNEKNQILKST